MIFVPSPQDSIKKQEKKPIHPMDKKGRNKILSSMFWSLFSPLLGFITMVGFWSEGAFIFGPIFGILLSLGFWIWGMSLFKKAENDIEELCKNINIKILNKKKTGVLSLCKNKKVKLGIVVKKIEELSFEESFKQLNETIELLEKGEISLDESIKLYEQGLQLKNHCEEKLKNAELKIQKVIEKNK